MAIESPIRISTDVGTLTDETEFLGEIMADEIEPGQYGPQFHLAVKPLTFAIAGKTGWFHEWAKVSRHKRSKLGALVARFGDTFGPKEFLGEGSFIGKRAWFIRQDIVFGIDRETGEEMKSEGVLQPVRPLAPGDEALIVAPGASGAPRGPAPLVAVPTEYTDEEIDLLLAVLEGANADRLAIAAARSNLPAGLKQAVMTGTALEALAGMGLVTIGADRKVAVGTGVVVDAEPEPEPVAASAAPRTRGPKFATSS